MDGTQNCTLTPRSTDGKVRVLQLSDCHLFADESGELLGVNTAQSFKAVLGAAREQGYPCDLVLVTGDISQDYSAASYRRFASMISGIGAPVFFLPGNHDDGPLEYRIFGELGISTARRVICGAWQFVLLNSEVYSQAHGWVLRSELEMLRQAVEERRDLMTCVCIHHFPLLTGSAWLDTQTLHNQDEFRVFVKRMETVRLVLSGHIHQEADTLMGQVRCIASPSTSIQFAPRSQEFELDTKAPGWRCLELSQDGSVRTEVCRLPEGCFTPNYSARGY